MPAEAAGRPISARTLPILALLMAFGPMSTDMYLPAMPAMAAALGATDARLQLTVSSFLIGFGLGQLLWGPVGDRYGRRIPAAIAVLLFLAGTAGCALSTSVEQMIGWRAVQALGACAGPVLARAMVRDLYEREEVARALSTLMLVLGVAPLLAPILGGQILVFAGWQAIFWSLLLFGAAALIGLALLPETLPAQHRASLKPQDVALGYLGLLASKRFLGPALAGGLFYGGVFTYLAGSPFAYVAYYHVPAELYGLLFAVNICGMIACNLVNRRLVPRLGAERLLRFGLGIAALAALALALAGHTGLGGLAGLAVPMFVFVGMLGFISANSMGLALAAWPQRAGTASALAGAMQFGLGALCSALLGPLFDGTPWPMTLVLALASLAALAVVSVLRPAAAPEPRALLKMAGR